jgi:hypothetical protein
VSYLWRPEAGQILQLQLDVKGSSLTRPQVFDPVRIVREFILLDLVSFGTVNNDGTLSETADPKHYKNADQTSAFMSSQSARSSGFRCSRRTVSPQRISIDIALERAKAASLMMSCTT